MRGTGPSTPALDEALEAILRLLKRRKIPHMVMGGLALSVWGRVRVTQDVDLVVGLEGPQERNLVKDLRQAGFLPAPAKAIVGHRLLICRYLKTRRGLPVQVDLFFARGDYQRQALRRAVEVTLGRRRLRIMAPEDLVLYKLLADRPIDRLDIQTILEEQKGSALDRKYLRHWAGRLGLSSQLRGAGL